jgi:hypothetical protein
MLEEKLIMDVCTCLFNLRQEVIKLYFDSSLRAIENPDLHMASSRILDHVNSCLTASLKLKQQVIDDSESKDAGPKTMGH